MDAILAAGDKYLNASEIHAAAQKQYPQLGIATVYKNLRMLGQEGWLHKFDLPDKAGCYAIDPNEIRCHLICLACGSISAAEGEFARNICDRLEKEDGFTVQKRGLVFYGYCSHCATLTQQD